MFVALKWFEIGKSYKFCISRCFCLNRPTNSQSERVQLKAARLAELLDCSLPTANVIIGKNPRILSLDDDYISKTALFCKYNLKFSDVIEYPSIFVVHHHVLSRRLHTLKELGCQTSATNIARFTRVLKGKPKLLSHKTFPYSEKFLKKIFNDSEKIAEVREKLLEMFNKECSFSDLKIELNQQYLMYRLKFSEERLRSMRTKEPAVFMHSLEDIVLSVKILMEKYGLTLAEIRQCPVLLTLHSNYLERYLELIPTILGIPLQKLIKKNLHILRKSPTVLKEFEILLQEFNITANQVLACPKILSVKSSTVRHRLQVLHNSKDFILFKTFRKFLWLVITFKHCHSRLKILKESGLAYSLSTFTLSSAMFKQRIFLNKSYTQIKDVIAYLADIYNINEGSVRKHISKIPNIYCTSFVDIHRVVNFLMDRGVSKEQLWNGLDIIIYEPEIVETFFNQLPYHQEFQPFSEWQGHFNLIQLLIYVIERSKTNSISSDKTIVLDAQENISNYSNKDESEELFREFGIDYFCDSDIDDADDDDSEEEEKISDVNKL